MVAQSKQCFSRRFSRAHEQGFTLVEVMVTMVIFSITSLGLTLLMVAMIGSNDYANQLTEATQLAEDKLEELKNECCLIVEPGTETIGQFTRAWSFVDNFPVNGLMKVTVTVSWADHKGRNHSTTLVTLMLPP
ncbi:MAG: prepilin-type N-terminal cleavage/methylation domain-containing protein [bacterium]